MHARRRWQWFLMAAVLLASAITLTMCGKDDGEPDNSDDTNNDVVRYEGEVGPSWEAPMVVIVEPDLARFEPDITLTGYAAGPVTDLRYSTDAGDGGELSVEGGRWSFDLELDPGDTTVTVTASTAEGVELSDSVTLTFHPDTAIELELSELGVFVGEGSTVDANVRVLGMADAVELVEVDETGAETASFISLADDGVGPDEFAGDFRFFGTFTPDDSTARQIRIRAAADVGGETVYSPVRTLHVLKRPSEQQLQTMLSLPDEAADWYNTSLESSSEEEAAAATVAKLEAHPEVTDVELTPGGDSITWRLDSGVQETLILRDELDGVSGDQAPSSEREQALTETTRVGNNEALLLAPFHTIFNATSRSDLEEVQTILEETFCPQIKVDPRPDEKAGVSGFDDIGGQGFVMITGHGGLAVLQKDDVLNRWGRKIHVPSFAVGAIATPAAQETYMVELMLKALTLIRLSRGGDPLFAITPIFVDHFVERLPDSIVITATCRSLSNGTMSGAFLAKGAKAVVGYERRTRIPYATTFNESLVERLALHAETLDDGFRYAATDAGGPEYGLAYVGDGSVRLTDRCNGWTRVIESTKLPGGIKTVYANYESTDFVERGPHGYDAVETQARCVYDDQSVTEMFGTTFRGSIVGSGSVRQIHEPPARKLVIHEDGVVGLVLDTTEGNWVTYLNWLSGTTPYTEEGSCLMSDHGLIDFSADEVTITDTEIRGSRREDFGGGNTRQIDFRYRR